MDMTGLLDFAKTPEGQGLLAAVAGGLSGARRGTPLNNIGRGAMAGLVGYSEAQKSSLELEQKKQMAALTKQMMGEMAGGDGSTMPNAQAALSQGAQGGSVGPTTQNAAVMDSMPPPQQSSGISLPTLQKAALLGMKNIEPLFNMHKYQKDGIERKAGSFYRNPTTGEEEYISDPTKGFNYDQKTKTVSPITGYSDTIAAQEGAKTRATEAAKADFNLLPLGYAGPDGRPIGGTVGNYVSSLNSAPQAQPKTPQQSVAPAVPRSTPRLPNQRPEGFPVVTTQQQQGRDAESYRIISDELANERDPANRAVLQRELQRISPQGAPTLQSEAEKTAQLENIKGRQGTTNELNKNWISNSYNPVLEQGKAANSMVGNLDALRNIDLKTGWGTEAKAQAASVLTGLGIAPKNAEMFAANTQKFQAVAMDRLLVNLQAQKGPQTEGDSTRAQATFAQLKNTPQANAFISDFARAKANQDVRKAKFYQEALPLATDQGDLNEIDRRWSRIQGSIWADPALQPYAKKEK